MNSGPQGVFAALMRFLKAPELLNFILEDPLSKKRAEAYESEVNSYIRRFGTGSGDLTMPVGSIQTVTIVCQGLEGIWGKLPEGGERDKWIEVYLDYALLFKDMLETRDFPLALSNRFLDACREGVDFKAAQKGITSVGTLNFNLSENRSVARGIYADVGRARLRRNDSTLSTPSSFAAGHLHNSASSRNKPNRKYSTVGADTVSVLCAKAC